MGANCTKTQNQAFETTKLIKDNLEKRALDAKKLAQNAKLLAE